MLGFGFILVGWRLWVVRMAGVCLVVVVVVVAGGGGGVNNCARFVCRVDSVVSAGLMPEVADLGRAWCRLSA